MTKRNKIFSIIYLVLGVLFISYSGALLIRSPGTFYDNITSFTNIWLLPGAFFIFAAVYRIRKGHSFWCDSKKWLKITFAVVVGTGILICAICLCFIFNPELISQEEIDSTESIPYMILLGGGIDKNGQLPVNVLKRVDVAADYLKDHKETVCVVTGGQLKWLPFAEAPELKNQLVKRGIEQDRILVEDKALDTIQNFKYSCKMLENYAGISTDEILNSPILVVSNYFHLRRAERLAHRMGFTNIKGLGANVDPFYGLHIYVREIAAYIKLNMRILLTGEPSTLAS